MRKKSKILLYKLMFRYCIYQLSLKVEYKDPRRCDRYNLLLDMICIISDIQNDNEVYQDILFDYYEYDEDWGKKIATDILAILGDNLDIGIWEIREGNFVDVCGDKKYLYDELYETIVQDIDIKKILSHDYVEELKDLKSEEEKRQLDLADKYSDMPLGHIPQDNS